GFDHSTGGVGRAHASTSATALESTAAGSGSSITASLAALRASDSARMRTSHGMIAAAAIPADHQKAVPYALAAAAWVCAPRKALASTTASTVVPIEPPIRFRRCT